MAVIDNLKVSKGAMEEAISAFETKKTALENAYLNISNQVRTLDGSYHGQASEAFKTQFDGLFKNLQQNEAVMTNVISKVKAALATYEEQEDTAKGLVEGIDVGTAYQGVLS